MLFRIIGGILGWKFMGFIGFILGWWLVGVWSRYLKFGSGGINPFTNNQRQAVFTKTVFSLMGLLAKADGRISEDEIAHVERFMAQMGMKEEHKTQAKEHFRQGAQTEFDMNALLDEFMSACGSTANLRQILLAYIAGVVFADGKLHPTEESLLRQVANRLGFNDLIFDQMMSMFRNQGHFSSGFGGRSQQSHQQQSYTYQNPNAVQDAYAALGVNASATDSEIKKAYRRLMSQYHPDKLTGQGVPEDMIKMATEKTKEIQAAYDLIKKHRMP